MKKKEEREYSVFPMLEERVIKRHPDETKPLKHIMEKQKYAFLTSDPENVHGHTLLRKKFGLPKPD